MAETRRLAIDLANVMEHGGKGAKCIATLAWGDAVQVDRVTAKGIEITLDEGRTGFIKIPSSGLTADDILDDGGISSTGRVLRVDFVDVQQGDGTVLETPAGRTMLIDGGDNQLFARYLAARFRGTTAQAPKEIDCILITHGDADHFAGLTEIHRSERGQKRLFIHPKRFYHNGLVKRPSKGADGKSVPPLEMLGATEKVKDVTFITGLEDDPRHVDEAERNKPFNDWCRALDAWAARGGEIDTRRLDWESDGPALFDFLNEGLDGDVRFEAEVLGPVTEKVKRKSALKFLGEPTPRVGRNPDEPRFTGFSASHTINGHSVILRLKYGNVRFLFAGDLNEEAEELLVERHPDLLESEVFKVPHHGSADYSAAFLKAVSPVVSVVSSGDEKTTKEHIHPRATLVAALGRHSRAKVEEPLVLVTELAAFFAMEGKAVTTPQKGEGKKIFAFSRTAFGIIKVRTDGERMLVYTYSGKDNMKEAYAFTVDKKGRVKSDRIRKC